MVFGNSLDSQRLSLWQGLRSIAQNLLRTTDGIPPQVVCMGDLVWTSAEEDRPELGPHSNKIVLCFVLTGSDYYFDVSVIRSKLHQHKPFEINPAIMLYS